MLDLLLSEVSDDASYLLDQSFDALLNSDERALADAVRQFAALVGPIAELPAVRPVVEMLRAYGGDLRATEARDAPERLPAKGSKQRMREVVERRQSEVQTALDSEWPEFKSFRTAPLEWLSPRARDGYRELQDDFWVRAGLPGATPQEDGFWPSSGPVWDGVAIVPGTQRDGVLLVEAKSHQNELKSGATAAAGEPLAQIEAALADTKRHLGAAPDADWSTDYYQLANRLAYLYYLRVRRGIPAWLLFIYSVGDSFRSGTSTVTGPRDPAGWRAAITDAERTLGLPESHPLGAWTHKLFLEV